MTNWPIFALILLIVILLFRLRSYWARESREIHSVHDVLLDPEKLIIHAKEIAINHAINGRTKRARCLLRRLEKNFRRITFVYKSLSEQSRENRDLSPSAEWLLDNFYLIEEQVQEIKGTLSQDKYSQLKILSGGYLQGYPRVYAIALELVSHTNGRLDGDTLISFVNAYQSRRFLSTAEIWSLSLMVRIALIEYLRNLSDRIYQTQTQWEKVKILKNRKPEEILAYVKRSFAEASAGGASFLEHLLGELRKLNDDATAETLSYLKEGLSEWGIPIDRVIEQEHQEQASRKISMGNAITSLKTLSTMDWTEIFESLSMVDAILRQDPSEVYPAMDFASRDYYRRQVSLLARLSRTTEVAVARKALNLAAEAPAADNRRSHAGYYLLGPGRKDLLEALGRAGRWAPFHNYPFAFYLFPLIFLTSIFIVSVMIYAFQETGGSIFWILLAGLVFLLPASELAVLLVNRFFTRIMAPAFLPKMEYRDGLPPQAATLVVIPTLLPSVQRVEELLEGLEVYYLANKEDNLYFALAGDFKDAESEKMPGDQEIIDAGLAGVEKLNEKYAQEKRIFFFFHRCRQFNPSQGNWVGWERKRGALVELNRLLEGDGSTSYTVVSQGFREIQGRIKYVITLDADTQLPLHTAKKLIGTISHPLNKGIIDEETGIVRQGYGLIQPRIGIGVESANRSLFTKVFAGRGGLDPYTTAISDIYQDLFGEGIFAGKGIYDLSVFNRLLKNRLPENRILSHDLLEGSYVRTGLATDIELIDGYPASYSAYSTRFHRWVRGDWQLLPWLGRRIKNGQGQWEDNPLSLLSKWKIFDNMRRSLMSPALLLLIFLGLWVLPGKVEVWLGLALLIIFFPVILEAVGWILAQFHSPGARGSGLLSALIQTFLQSVFILAFLPYQAWLVFDAVIRTLYRLYVSGRNLLEWVTAADVERTLKTHLLGFIKRMQSAPFLGLILLGGTVFFRQPLHWAGYSLAFLWLIAPVLAYWISRPLERKKVQLPPEDQATLRRLARKIWAYYEDLAGPENNYLPPDNYQEDPPNGVARRTSPTNIGFLFIATIAARDFGYLSTTAMVERIEKMLATMARMETWKGHLFNWYSTKTLEPLRPLFVSTVDSGNYAGYLITAQESLKEFKDKPLFQPELLEALKDTAALTAEKNQSLQKLLSESATDDFSLENWQALLDRMAGLLYGEDPWEKKLESMVASFREELFRFYPSRDICRAVINEGAGQKAFGNLPLLLEKVWTTARLPDLFRTYREISHQLASLSEENEGSVLSALAAEIERVEENVKEFIHTLDRIVDQINNLVEQIDFTPLYDRQRDLFAIGYSKEDEKLTNSYYDLLASEARLASYLAIARREVPQKHWFKLGRSLSLIDGQRALVSWSGTMFEYLMPPLIMKSYDHTLLDQTYAAVVTAQKNYGKKRRVPWGTSESGYYAFDLLLNYQYKAFGIPDLGLKRGLIEDMVVSPYSSLLALPFDPAGAMANIRRLLAEGLEGRYGLYEAVDYTPERLPGGVKGKIVKSFMAHHLGMSLVALDNYFHDQIMPSRFHANPLVKAAEILLEERAPEKVIITKERKKPVRPLPEKIREEIRLVRSFSRPLAAPPFCHLLSNGRYLVMVTDRGGGFSKKGGLQVTRWREDAYGGKYGFYIFLKNNKDQIWSATLDPFGQEADGYRAVFSLDRAEYFRTDDLFHTHTEIMVSPEDDVEIRRVIVTNHYAEAVTIEFSSYLEPVMAAQAADLAHPAFSKLFVQTEVLPEEESLLAMRRPRGQDEERLWAFHSMFVEGEKIGSFQYESCRGNFIGRGKDISCPQALKKPLTKTVGAVLDPAMSLRGLVRIEPGESASVTYLLGLTASREEALELIRKYRSSSSLKRAAEMALTRSQVGTHFFNFQAEEISTYQDMVSQLFFPSPLRKKYARVIAENTKGQSGLWAYGISGDLPLVLVSVSKREHVELVREAFRAHEYWRTKGLEVDLVILNEDQSKYFQPLQDLLEETVASSYHKYLLDTPGGVHLRNAQLMPSEDCRLFYTAARIILKGGEGTLKRQIQVHQEREEVSYPPLKVFPEEPCSYPAREELLPELLFFNGFGGFSRDGKEYIIQLKEGLQTPAPWINVIANKKFGFLISESGSGCIWAENSRENKLTPWSNDPVSDPPGEVVYLRDEKSGEVWTITPLPIREKEACLIRHGAGYTSFQHVSHGLGQKLTCFVPLEDSLKISLINLKNHSDKERSLSLTYYIRPVLGVSDQLTQAYLTTEFREDKGIFLIKNLFSADFPGRLVFLASSEKITSFTGHRGEFLGAGDLKRPEALQREGLSGKTGFALDPCAALQVQLQLQPGEEKELVFLLGQGLEYGAVKRMVREYRSLPNCRDALVKVKDYWEKILGTIQVETPDLSLNLMINRWLLYQIIVCRLWGRSAFYQAGGAYGFRDQLQDALNCLYVSPEITRKQLLLHGSRQFIEGDVQHWWHPDLDERGVRTKFSDDLLWLPYVTAEYLEQTGDYQILHVLVPFLVGEPLAEDQAEKYGPAQVSTEKASLYEHCLRAIRRSLRFGRHGLPLIGSGDWNDGFSNVGTQGQGESVWLGWFLYNILMRFIPICEKMGDPVQAQAFRQAAARIVNAIEDEAWDGGWYRRAYFDDGTPLGSAANSECMIDSLSQSWAVISGGARVDRARMAMEAVDYYLVKREEGLILLFTPPFDAGELEPGYIKGYVPGVRENGAQYTHAAAWVIKAMALLGDGDRAWELFHLVNPINHSRTPLECAVYRVEPYVAAADVYSANSQVGRGGWTWYTGAAGWLYRVALENILGLKKKGDTLLFNPCIPKSWNSYQMNYVFKQTPYRIIVRNPRGVNKGVQEVRLDGRVLPGKQVALVDDRQDHLVEVILG